MSRPGFFPWWSGDNGAEGSRKNEAGDGSLHKLLSDAADLAGQRKFPPYTSSDRRISSRLDK
jgi:hypothetical protein